MDGISIKESVSFLLVFFEGVVSFFSPCVIPLLPVYMSLLAGNTKKIGEDGLIHYDKKNVLTNTFFFVLGISFAFFVLGMSFTALGSFFSGNKALFIRIGGILIILLGLFQLGVFDLPFLQRERKIPINLVDKKINPFIALILGFTFSFAWTPCIGPALSSVLIMASGAKTAVIGNILVFLYAAGFVIPFLFLGLFTTQALEFLKGKQKLLKYSIKAGGVMLILIGIMTFTGFMNGISSYLNSIQGQNVTQNKNSNQTDAKDGTSKNKTDINNETGIKDKTDNKNESDRKDETNTRDEIDTGDEANKENETDSKEEQSNNSVSEFDFTLKDQYGKEHTLSDYKGKVVFLNFWATWCPPCKEELPHIEELYKKYNKNKDDVVIIGVTNPKSDDYPFNQDENKDKITEFLDTKGYTFPTVFDETGDLLRSYNISAFPTTFIIDKKGIILGYIPGKMTKDIMESVIKQGLEDSK